jgi:PKD repeat protein/photosystem II stability/assembly factor-like uncharacterized protein
MNGLAMRLGAALWLCGLVVFSSFSSQAGSAKLTDPELAAKLGIKVQTLHSLRIAFELTNEQLLSVSSFQLDAMLEGLSHPGFQKHAEEENFKVLRMMDEHGKIPPDGLLRALEHRKQIGKDEDLFPAAPDPSTNTPNFGEPQPFSAGIGPAGWTWLGPGNIGGRVRSILIHPTATNIMWLGGVDGGVWKTTNNAASWFPLNDFMANLAVACMAMDPTDANIIYAGTGEPTYNADAIRGAGIFKTIDGGSTWTQLAASGSFQYVSRLAIDPNNGQNLLTATRGGIYRSTNGGTNWTQTSGTEMNDIDFHPTDSSQCIAAGRNGDGFYSTNGGATWFAATGLAGSRVEVAYARSSPSTVYASVDNSSGQLYVSGDGGHTYSLRNTGRNYLSNQGWYANALWVDPTTTNVVVVGGLDLWRSTDGGGNFSRISQWQSAPNSAHADHHFIIQSPAYNGTTVKTVFFANDGGIYRANDVSTVGPVSGWQELNNTLGITQFYGGAGNPNTSVIVGGTQDNGDLRYTTGGGTEGWTMWNSGDGGVSAADPTNSNYFYGEYVFLELHRSSNGGSSASDIFSGIADAGNSSTANFIAPFILDPNNPNTMLAGGLSLWRSTNVKAGTPAWTSIKAAAASPISAITVAPGNSAIIWVGHNSGEVYYTTNGTAASPAWFQTDLGTPNLPNRFCSRIAIAPGASNRVYVTFGGYNSDNVWRTADSGVTWSNITGNLPAAPVNSIVVAPADTNTLYVGTEVGIYGSSNGGSTWSTGNEGPANVAVDEVFWLGNKLVAATHGRGMFYITPVIGGANLAATGSAISGGNGNGSVDPNECNQLSLVVQNAGGATASNITATLTTTTPGIIVGQGTSGYANLGAGATGSNTTAFQISSTPSFPCGTTVALTLTLAYDGGTNTVTYSLPSGGTNYILTTSGGASIVAGSTDTGNHGDDVVTAISLPFTFTMYGQAFSNATLSSNGNLQFASSDNEYNNVCLPHSGFTSAIAPLWDDLRTDGSGGIFTSVSGSAPNRIFNIEWRATYFTGGASANFEIRLYEGQPRFDIVYGVLNDTGASATAGIEKDQSTFLQFECSSGGLSNGLQLTFQQICVEGGGSCVPLVNFTGAPTNGLAPLTVSFTNSTVGATNYSWDFGDGHSSTSTNAANIYTNAGSYTVSLLVIGPTGTNTLTRTNYILVTNAPPVITMQPLGQAVNTGGTATFSVTATGSPPLSYQWQKNGTNIVSATAASFTLTNAQLADAGIYSVMITNVGGTLASSNAMLNVMVIPGVISITGDPYLENFDEMGAAGTNTPAGWYVGTGSANISGTVVGITAGTSATSGNYNFGSTGSPDRALGSLAAVSTQRDTEARFVNLSGSLIVSFNIGYSGEQWRLGGASGVNNTLVMQYSIDGTNFAAMGSQFDFNTPTDSGTAGALDGNNPTNRVTGIGGAYAPGPAITNGQVFYLRWADEDDPGNDQSMAVDDFTMSFVLSNPPPPVVPGFTAAPTNGLAPLMVVFTNLSTGASNFFWNFGDGNSSTATNTANIYSNAGSYSVSLTVIGPGGTDTLTRTNYITVTNDVVVTNPPPPAVVADFTGDPTHGLVPLTVMFTNLSTGATNYTWDFGDGNMSASVNPTNTYANAGTYSITLTAIGAGGTNSLMRTNYVKVTDPPPPPVVADFSGDPTNGVAPLTVVFTNLSTGATNYLWDFGDGTTSSATNAANTYSNAGSFAVQLTAIGPGGTNTATRTNYVLITNPALLVVMPPILDFGLWATGTTSQASLIVSNSGDATLNGSATNDPGPFVILTGTPFSLAPAASTNLVISFAPTTAGVFSNEVTVISNGGNSTNALLGRAIYSPLLIPLPFANQEFDFSFETLAGFIYVVQYKDFLSDPAWQSQQSVTGNGNASFITNSVASPDQRLYRVLVR